MFCLGCYALHADVHLVTMLRYSWQNDTNPKKIEQKMSGKYIVFILVASLDVFAEAREKNKMEFRTRCGCNVPMHCSIVTTQL